MSAVKTSECPKCWVKMDVKEIEVFGPNVSIDACPKCHGIWLDGGELSRLLGDRKLTSYLTKDIGTKARSPLICPRCRNLMDFEKAGDVETEVCLTCHGVWFDAGELDELKNVSKKGFVPDKSAKEEERFEDAAYKERNSSLNRFFRHVFG